ncbi:MAG TPA: hypothetical protein VER55_08365, partial [Ardenticatenaceae bacterium]|nr:hypothetical protein [Ardenticatenaceae bacterium]
VVLIFVAVAALGFRRGALTVRGTALGFLALLLAMIVVVLVTSVVWTLIRALHPGGQIWALQYNADLFWLGFASLAIAATTTLYNWLRQRIGLGDLALGALFWPLLSMIFVSLFLPAASYSLTWPLLSSLLGLAALFVLRAGPALRWQRFVVLALSAIPILLLFAPGLNGVTLPVGLLFPPMVIVFALVLVLLLGLLVPHLEALARPNPWAVPGSTAALGLLLLLFGSLTAGFDARHPQPNDIFYALDATTRQAIWASGDEAPDAWTAQFLGTNPTKGSVAGYLPGESSALLYSEAPPVALPAPDVTLLDTRIRGGVRTLRLRITAPVDATFFDLIVPDKSLVKGASVNGRPVPDGLSGNGASAPWSLRYWNPPADGVEVALDIDGAEAVTLAATVATRGLPSVPGTSSTPRPPEMMASNLQEERTLVSKSFTFAARP